MATWKKYAKEDNVPLKTLWAAKGTLVAASAANTPVGVAVGTDGQLLVADAASAGGVKWQTGATPAAHAASHQNGGADEISVADLSGLLADDQHVLDAEVTAVIEATPLNDLATADGAVDFGGQQATDFVIHEVANAAALAALTAVVGKVAFQVDTLDLYVCTAV